jgi:hypothetical protein
VFAAISAPGKLWKHPRLQPFSSHVLTWIEIRVFVRSRLIEDDGPRSARFSRRRLSARRLRRCTDDQALGREQGCRDSNFVQQRWIVRTPAGAPQLVYVAPDDYEAAYHAHTPDVPAPVRSLVIDPMHRSHVSHGSVDHKPYGSVVSIWTVRLEKIRAMLAYAKLAHDN